MVWFWESVLKAQSEICLFQVFYLGLLLGLRRWRICWQWRRLGFNHWMGKIPWRREWEPTPAFFPGEFNGQRSLAGYTSWVAKSQTWLSKLLSLILGDPLRAGGEGDDRGWDGCMASPTHWTQVWVDSGSWWGTGRPGMLRLVHGVTKSWTWLSDWTELN